MPEPIAEIVVEVPPVMEVDEIATKDAEIIKLKEERDNYKNVALKRLGKLPGDAEFMKNADEDTGLTVEETVKQTLLDREIAKIEREKSDEIKSLQRKLSEANLALKNRPGSGSIGGNDGGATVEVKDNVYSAEQLSYFTARATKLKLDPVKYIESMKKAATRR